jgi:hypothetical protein
MFASKTLGKANELRVRRPALYALLMLVLFVTVGALLSAVVVGLSLLGSIPVFAVVSSIHSIGEKFGYDTYQAPTSWILLLTFAWFATYVWIRWLQPAISVRAWVYNMKHFYPNYGPEPANLERYLARHRDALTPR